MFAEFFRGWIVVELFQLTGASWMLFSDPEKFRKCFYRANAVPPAADGLLHFVLLGNLNHLLLKLFLLFNRRFSKLHILHALYNLFSALFFVVEMAIFGHFALCPFVLTQFCFNVASALATTLFWANNRLFGQQSKKKTEKPKKRNANMRKFDYLISSRKKCD
ncbi:hypothetical protein niasHS_001479 [Heterodera schachtii]|uniref:Very-long-chain 3-oxoacyl-CoA synthase n=1 Tax=Heterodera schachtii TaxID=97005 RepID=A0ABD2KEU2_HETSC